MKLYPLGPIQTVKLNLASWYSNQALRVVGKLMLSMKGFVFQTNSRSRHIR